MGAVDLVLQVESPKSVTAGLQRIGRAGHNVGDTSKGRIFPKFRADLLECAVVAQRMREGKIETTVVPRNPLDVLAQQIVAMAASTRTSRCTVDDAAALVAAHVHVRRAVARRSSRTCSTCSTAATRREEFGELRPRIVWDRVAGTIRARKGARALADHQRRHDPRPRAVLRQPPGRPPRRRARRGDGLRGAARARCSCSARRRWRIEEITRDRVIVTPAPGVPGAVPFWKGDGVGRPRELGEAIGAFARWAVDQDAGDAGARLRPRPAARPQNLVEFLREQQEATRVVPSDRTIVVERFRDEIGDWRLCILSPVRRPRARRLGPRAERPDPRRVRPRVRRDLVRRRDHRPPPRRRRAARRRARADRSRRARGPGRRRARRLARCSARASARTPAARC